MKPVKFPGHNMTLAEDQPEYQPLPVCYQGGREVVMTSCWNLSLWERVKLLFTGKLYLSQFTFGQRLQPQLPQIDWKEPKCQGCGLGIGAHKYPKMRCPTKYRIGAVLKITHPEFGDGLVREGTIAEYRGSLFIVGIGWRYPVHECRFI